ncbi:Rrf2 family transcriptional regulator [Roseisolibacter sp. H3M3-2]|uniref:RrF2 family transcriptional regulator n=1 Tax=Roseisolibacter sp. H3M3-2 TaxID=3031323 RepID=UPI0023DA89E6|nr:Rrf2 family transcriptional regulator [Roseisolibacter sp. H3M3-2]MDF1504650.1 Rrf2 family transcriptional regulator [Roseisolibacter sp. H3M3-2]
MTASRTSDYAIRATLVLARGYGGPPMRAGDVAGAIGAPRNYLGKTLHALARAGVATSSRGPTGGFALAVDPAALTLAQVVDLFDAPARHARCLLGTGAGDARRACAAHHRWAAVERARRTPLLTTTFASLLGAPPDAG